MSWIAKSFWLLCLVARLVTDAAGVCALFLAGLFIADSLATDVLTERLDWLGDNLRWFAVGAGLGVGGVLLWFGVPAASERRKLRREKRAAAEQARFDAAVEKAVERVRNSPCEGKPRGAIVLPEGLGGKPAEARRT